ncbi:MAG: sodium:proline symporter, partial [Bacteroidota bacterium]|nr:sodium:proline symporter [Bacteroidota bacterium]
IGTFLAWAGVQWWSSWYPGAEPGGGGYIAQRMMSAKNEKHSLWATLFFQVAHYSIRPWPWIIVGLCAIVLYPNLTEGNLKLGYVLAMRDYLPNGLKGLLLVTFLAAYMSTISSQLNWGSSYFINDLYKRFIKPESQFENENSAQKHYVLASRLFILLAMGVALYVTTLVTSISGAWEFILQCGAGLGLVLILRWYWWRINVWSEWAATITPFIIYGGLKLLDVYLRSQNPDLWSDLAGVEGSKEFYKLYPWLQFPYSFFITTSITTIVWLIVTFSTKPESKELLERFYLRVRPQGSWDPIRRAMGLEKRKSTLSWLFLAWL